MQLKKRILMTMWKDCLRSKKTQVVILSAICFLMNSPARGESYSRELSFSFGMSNVSYAEVESKVKNEGSRPGAQSGSISILSFDLRYKFLPTDLLDYYIRFSAPVLTSSGDNYFSGHIGANYYFGGRGSITQANLEGSRINFTPKLRYFAGAELGVASLVFSNELVKRSDTVFNIGVHGGVSYSISRSWGVQGTLHLARGTGTNTTTTAIQFFAGATYFFGI